MAVVVFGALFHILLLLGLVRAFAPGFTQAVADQIVSVLTVNLPAVEPSPEPTAIGDEGASAPEGRLAKPKEVAAPEPEIRIAEKPAAKAASTGTEFGSGARDAGEGTGGGGPGLGAGAGNGGFGQGGGAVQKLEKIAGDISSARDYPKATRKEREGQSVTIQMTVGTDGRASNCRVVRPSPVAEADDITCRLALERFRFKPRTDARGVAVPGEFQWRQRWWDPRD